PRLVEGGFSGLFPVEGAPGEFWTVSDRGPNGDTFNVGDDVRRPFQSPAFTPSIYRIKVTTASGRIDILQRIPLRLRHGFTDPVRAVVGGTPTHVTGFGNTGVNAAANVPVSDEIPTTETDNDGDIDAADATLPFDPYGVDTEGIVFDKRTGTFWLVEEYRPSILQVSLDGTIVQRITPRGQNLANLGPAWGAVLLNDILPAEYSRRRDNRGFEGVAISADGLTLYAIMQNPLATSCSGTDPITGTPFVSNNNRSATRVVKVDISHPFIPKLAGDFIYTLDTNATGNALNNQLRISDLFLVGPDRLLVDERDDTAGVAAQGQPSTTTKHLYEVDLAGATNVQTLSPAARSCLDALRPAGVAGRGVTAGVKTSVLDLGSTAASPEYPFAKLEGITKLPNGNFATVNDNDFQVGAAAGVPTRYIEYGRAAPAA
ncbi:MAG: esterase-like activity of phytase family protein, partial [Acidimicrobiales bacterium]